MTDYPAGVFLGEDLLPYLLLALGRAGDGAAQARIGRRFSLIALGAVAVLIAAGLGMAVPYIGSLDAIYGTAYGVMVATKALLLLGLLFLGGMNYLLVERLRRVPGTPVLRLKRFADQCAGTVNRSASKIERP